MPKQDKLDTTAVEFHILTPLATMLEESDPEQPGLQSLLDKTLERFEQEAYFHLVEAFKESLLEDVLAVIRDFPMFEDFNRKELFPSERDNLINISLIRETLLSPEKDGIEKSARHFLAKREALRKKILAEAKRRFKEYAKQTKAFDRHIQDDVKSATLGLADHPLATENLIPNVRVSYRFGRYGDTSLAVMLTMPNPLQGAAANFSVAVHDDIRRLDLEGNALHRTSLTEKVKEGVIHMFHANIHGILFENIVRPSIVTDEGRTSLRFKNEDPFMHPDYATKLIDVNNVVTYEEIMHDLDYARILHDYTKQPARVRNAIKNMDWMTMASPYDLERQIVSRDITFEEYKDLVREVNRNIRKANKEKKEVKERILALQDQNV